MTTLPLVVGALIVDRFPGPSKVLAARRTRPPSLAGQWEFPGGKLEPGETPASALRREISEELAIDIAVHAELPPPDGGTWPASHGYRMRLFYATASGEPAPRDGHDAVQWLTATELCNIAWLESDRDVLPHLRLEGEVQQP